MKLSVQEAATAALALVAGTAINPNEAMQVAAIAAKRRFLMIFLLSMRV
jgi:hypothetical protein